MSDFDITRLNPLSDFLIGVRTINRIGDDATPLDGRVSLANTGALILYHSARAINDARYGYNRDRWDDLAEKVYNLALTTRQACRKSLLPATAFVALKSSISIGQLCMGETRFDPSQLPDSVLAGFGVKIAPKVKDKKAEVREWMEGEMRRHDEYVQFANQVIAARQAGRSITQEVQVRATSGTGLPAVRVVGEGRNRYMGMPGTKLLVPLPGGR